MYIYTISFYLKVAIQRGISIVIEVIGDIYTFFMKKFHIQKKHKKQKTTLFLDALKEEAKI